MRDNEIFEKPFVQKVMFEMRFPNLFYIEQEIPSFQLKIIKKFPSSSLLYSQQFIIAKKTNDDSSQSGLSDIADEPKGDKIWRFESEDGYTVNITTHNLSILSDNHITYNSNLSENKFRDIIEFVTGNFFEKAPPPTLTRIGLRYINKCPIQAGDLSLFKKDNETLDKYYNSVFPTHRFDFKDTEEMLFLGVFKNSTGKLRYSEKLEKSDEGYNMLFDLDASAENKKMEELLPVVDSLHERIKVTFKDSLKSEMFDYMRGEDIDPE